MAFTMETISVTECKNVHYFIGLSLRFDLKSFFNLDDLHLPNIAKKYFLPNKIQIFAPFMQKVS